MTTQTKNVPVLPIRNTVAFPEVAMPFLVRRTGGVAALRRAERNGDRLVLAVAQKHPDEREARPDDLFGVGTLIRIEKLTGSDQQGYQVLVKGVARFRIDEITRDGDHLSARGEVLPDQVDADPATMQTLLESVKKLGHEILDLIPGDTEQVQEMLEQIDEPAYLTHVVSANMDAPFETKQSLLENVSLKGRLLQLLDLLQSRREKLRLQADIRNRMTEKLSKNQREAILREQMRAIREELGESDESGSSPDNLRKKIEDAGMPEDVRKVALSELDKLESGGGQSAESNVIRNYLDWLVSMPWQKSSHQALEGIDLAKAEETLDQDHSGLDKIKKRILQHLAVMKLKKKSQGTILLFVGPPGVGKTSLGQSIAKALGRKFVRASVGGLRDDAEIRGHRRTYIGAMPGRIIQGLKRAGENDPVFMLDEIDKLSHSFYGDPASALLEVLDPEQNKAFYDQYLDVPFDLSNIVFVATANSLESIPAPLLDRMEVIQLTGYTTSEKLEIAKKYLVPKQAREAGLSPEQVSVTDETLNQVIAGYTRESGVRELQRRIGALFRSAAEKVARSASGKLDAPVVIDPSWLDDVFGPIRYVPEVSERMVQPGVVTGLAWTPVGGEILFIEASSMPGHGKLILTGQLGDVMKESAQIALSLVRSKLASLAPEFDFDKKDLHIHVPSGAIPKDGPSAGITMMTAIASLFTGKVVSHELAMTGEITLRGAVTPVGGIKEKVIAAHRAGIKSIILSRRNQKDIREVPEEVRKDLTFHFVDTAAEVLKLALGLSFGDGAGLTVGGGGTEGVAREGTLPAAG